VLAGLTLRELNRNQFLATLEACVGVYAAAMNPPAEQLPGRYVIMERHSGYAAFRAIAAIMLPDGGEAAESPAPGGQATVSAPPDGQATVSAPRGGQATGGQAAGSTALGGETTDGARPRLVGFAYGFHGSGGQWWHDVVRRAATSVLGTRAADDWFSDSLEIAEVHVLPGYQGRGTGLAMMLRLTSGRPERSAVLSTMDANTRARRLYHGLGFTDLLTGFEFPGTDLPYAIMGAPLPLPGASPGSARPGKPSRW
jgi:ribosomal protein S18 acetylase RimI-like enzyme